MEVLDCIKKRRSIREFNSKPVERKELYRILEAGSFAPSSGNMQNWRFIIVEDKDKIEDISKSTLEPECFDNVSTLVIVCSQTEKVVKAFKESGKVYAIQNVAAAIQNMLLEATELGIDSLWIGAFAEQRIRKILSIPEEIDIHAIIVLGHRQKAPERQTRIPIAHITFFDEWNEPDAQKHFFPLSKQLKKIMKRK